MLPITSSVAHLCEIVVSNSLHYLLSKQMTPLDAQNSSIPVLPEICSAVTLTYMSLTVCFLDFLCACVGL